MHTPELASALIGKIFRASGIERDQLAWECYVQLADNLTEQRPPLFAEQPLELRGKSREELATAVAEVSELGKTFAAFRAAVTEVEAERAKRLLVLGSAVRRLAQMRERAADRDAVQELLMRIASFIAAVWRVDIPNNGDLRAWSSRSTRAYDLLPRNLREL